ncbi:MAG: type IV secretory system conjugative DNA transfer family protein [Minisyncoccia bacterium]
METFDIEKPHFSNPTEELAYLRGQVQKMEQKLTNEGSNIERTALAQETLQQYKKIPTKEVLHEGLQMSDNEHEAVALRLHPEEHDSVMEELVGLVEVKGIKNAIDAVARLNNPHIEDDFHRFLVQYLLAMHEIKGLEKGTSLYKTLTMKTFQLSFPEKIIDDNRTFKELVGAMEQFFAGLQYMGGAKNKEELRAVIEIAVSNDKPELAFYISIPEQSAELFEKQILAIHPQARIVDMPDDFNIFSLKGVVTASTMELESNPCFSLRTIENFDSDPLAIILNTFSRVSGSGEGAALQFVLQPEPQYYEKEVQDLLKLAEKGEKINKEDEEVKEVGKAFVKEIGSFFGISKNEEVKEEDKKEPLGNAQQDVISSIKKKLERPMVAVNVRILTSAVDASRAEKTKHDIESAFEQFRMPSSNACVWKHSEKNLASIIHEFTFREFVRSSSVPLNFKELATMVHFPWGIGSIATLKQSTLKEAPAPTGMAPDGVVLGYNEYRGARTPVVYGREDRMRHLYVIGQTGTGKTVTLKQLIKQDIENGDGCCFIDPHGSDIQEILSYIPKERIDDVIYFDPAYTERPMGLNMLEFDERFPEQKTCVINDLLGIFNQLFDLKAQGGAMFEQYFRNAALLVMEDPDSGSTLLEITRVLQEKSFRDMKLAKCKNPIIKKFWEAAEATTGDQGLANFVPYISSKFDPMISNDILRPVIGQQHSVFNFRKIMDEKKILLVNLSKGRLGEINANLIGLILVGKIQMAALSRVDMHGQKMNDFYLYIDEFQNVTTPAIASILSEARKYHLSLNVAHQYVSQLSEDIKNAIFGNVGSMSIMRVSPEDAKFLETKLAPTFDANDIIKLENLHSYVSMIVNGVPTPKPFNLTLADYPKGNPEIVENLKQLSYIKYGRDRAEVEAEIMAKYKI